jgi:uncharacterized metal-binding protein YceD (DUF177 family)
MGRPSRQVVGSPEEEGARALLLDSRAGRPIVPHSKSGVGRRNGKLKFNIKDIGVSGKTVSEDLGDTRVRELLSTVEVHIANGKARLRLDLELTRQESQVLVRGALEGGFFVECSRCIGPAEVLIEEPALALLYLPPRRSTEEEPEEGDLDDYRHDGDVVDLEPAVREHLVLGIPMAPLCREDCKGLCLTCGADLNREPCGCDAVGSTVVEKPWVAALSRLKQKLPGQ